jgi:magnesium-transporting ATPase (P-type)
METKYLINTHSVENSEEIRSLATMSWSKLFELFSTSECGLSVSQAQVNLKKYGANQLLLEQREPLVIQVIVFSLIYFVDCVIRIVLFNRGESRGRGNCLHGIFIDIVRVCPRAQI